MLFRSVVTGCLVSRYGQDLRGELPEVDLFLEIGRQGELGRMARWAALTTISHSSMPMVPFGSIPPGQALSYSRGVGSYTSSSRVEVSL